MSEAAELTDKIRSAKLLSLKIIDTPAEQVYDDLVSLAAQCCKAPTAVLTFIDTDRAFVKASLNGPPLGTENREDAFCNTTIQQPSRTMIVSNAHDDPRFAKNWKVTSGMLTFYAGASVIADGVALGALCVVDTKPRDFSEENMETLEKLARVIAQVLIGCAK